MLLANLKKGQIAKIIAIKISSENKELMNSYGVRIGKDIYIMYRSLFSKTIAFVVGTQLICIPYKYQKLIDVKIS